MSIAPLNALVLTLTEEKAILEFTRMVLDSRRQTLAFQKAEISTQMQAAWSRYMCDPDESTSVEKFNWDQFQVEFAAAQAKLDAQDKILEMQRVNNDTKLEDISTALEGADKQKNKNIESEMKHNS